MRLLKFDLMRPIGGSYEKFIATMRYRYNPLWKFNIEKFQEWIESKRPTLKGQPYNVYTDDKSIKVLYFNQDINDILKQAR